jgi:hypothetical protein
VADPSTADRLIAALLRDYDLFMEVMERLSRVPRCGPWEPYPGPMGSMCRRPLGETGVVALVEPGAGGALLMLRGDVGVGKTSLSVQDAMELADRTLAARGWMFPPHTA